MTTRTNEAVKALIDKVCANVHAGLITEEQAVHLLTEALSDMNNESENGR